MDSEDDMVYEDEDESQEEDSNEEDEDFVDIAMEPEPSSTNDSKDHEDFPYEVLTADRIVHVMVECIKEVNAVVQVNGETVHWQQSQVFPEFLCLYPSMEFHLGFTIFHCRY